MKWAKLDFTKKIAILNKQSKSKGHSYHVTYRCISRYISLHIVAYHVTYRCISRYISLHIVAYPLLKSFQSLINNHFNIFYLNENSKDVFMPGPMVTFRSGRKLSSYLVRVKLYLMERVTGLCKCHGKRCEVCLNVNKTSTFTSSVTHETYKINHKFDCDIIANVLYIY